MSDVLDETGLKVKSYSEISDELKSKFWNIYGDNLNLDSNTQDGQMIGLFAQSGTDIRELIQNAWNDLFADTAQGVALDRLFSLVNVPREKGKKARILVTITTSKNVELKGLNDVDNQDSAFRINDGKGNDFLLEQSQTFEGAGIYNVYFEALNNGYIFVEPNSLTNIVTSVAGVESVSNESGITEGLSENSNGSDFESDSKFRHRAKLGNPANRNKGNRELIEAEILAIEGVDTVLVSDGSESGSINVVVKSGKENEAKIRNAIYRTKAAGIKECLKFAKPESLKYQLTVKDKDGDASRVDEAAIREVILSNNFDINQEVNQFQIANKVYNNFRNLVITESEVSIDGNKWLEVLAPEGNNYFEIKEVIVHNAHKGS